MKWMSMVRPQMVPCLALLCAVGSLGWALAACSSTSSPQSRKLVILHTSDEHSYLLAVGPEADDYPPATTAGAGSLIGGIARRATIFAREREAAAKDGASVLTLSSGDNLMGTLFQAATRKMAPDFRAMKSLGYDATTIGNHEFDFGPAFLAEAIAKAQSLGGIPPLCASNIHFSGQQGDASLAALFDESGKDTSRPMHRWLVLTTANGLRVGLAGVMGGHAAHDAPAKAPVKFSLPESGKDDDFEGVLTKLYAELQPVVDQLRNLEKVDLVIVLAHAGTDLSKPETGESYKIAQNVSGIDVLLSGHSHLTVSPMEVANLKTGKKVIVEEPGRYGDHVGKLALAIDPSGKVTIEAAKSEMIAIDDRIPADAAMLPLVNQAIASLETTKEADGRSLLERSLSEIEGTEVKHDPSKSGDLFFRTVGKTQFELREALQKESGLFRLDADAMLVATEAAAGKTDLSLIAAGIVRDGVWKGKDGVISLADVFRINSLGQSPVDGTPGYPILRLGLLALELKPVLEITASYSYQSLDWGDRFLLPSGICFEYDTSRPPFDMSGNPLDPNNGRVTRISLATDHNNLDRCDQVIFELPDGWKGSPVQLFTAATDFYLALFAESFGLILRGPDGKPLKNITDAILRRADGSEVKTYQALASYIRTLCASDGTLPARYNDNDPAGREAKRALCTGPLCR